MFLIVSRFEISKKKKIRFFETAKVDDPLNSGIRILIIIMHLIECFISKVCFYRLFKAFEIQILENCIKIQIKIKINSKVTYQNITYFPNNSKKFSRYLLFLRFLRRLIIEKKW